MPAAAPQPAAREQFVRRGRASLYVREIGQGWPIVVVHGGPDFDHEYLLPDLDRWAGSCRVVYYDQRGRGRSFNGEDTTDVTMASEVEDLDSVREHLGFGSVAVLGHSWGGLVAMEYAIRHPDRVSHLILMNTAPASHATAAAMRRALAAARTADETERLAALRADPRYLEGDIEADTAYYRVHFRPAVRDSHDLERLLPRLRAAFTKQSVVAARAIEERLYEETWQSDAYDLTPALRQLDVPTLVIHGDRDFVPVGLAAGLAVAIPGARLVVLADCGHFAYIDRPDDVERRVTEFVTSGGPLGPA